MAVLFAALVTDAAIDGSIERTVHDMLGRADLRVEGFTELGLSTASVEAIAGAPGVAAADARSSSGGRIPRRIRPPPRRRACRRRSPSSASIRRRTPRSTTSSSTAGDDLAGLDAPGALISERMARETGLAIGRSIGLQGADGPRTEPIVGILAGDGPLATTDGRTVVIGLGEARALFGTSGVSRVDVRIGDDTTSSSVAAELEARLTAEPYVLSGPAELAASIRASTVDFQATTALIAALALFGGAFLIFNTLSMTVSERAREVGLLRAAGATRRQVNGLVLVQALIIGLAGSGLGIVLGAGLAAVVAGYLRAAAIVPIDGPVFGPPQTGLAAIVGTVVTLAAALEPADRAGRIPPVEALRPRCRADRPGPPPLARGRVRRRRVRRSPALADLGGRPGRAERVIARPGRRRPLAGGLRGPAGRHAAHAVPAGAARHRSPALPFRLRRARRGAPHPRLARPRSEPDDADGRRADGRPGDDRRPRRPLASDARRAATAWIAGVVPGDVVATSIRPIASDEPVQADLAAAPGVARVSPIAALRGRLPRRPLRRSRRWTAPTCSPTAG